MYWRYVMILKYGWFYIVEFKLWNIKEKGKHPSEVYFLGRGLYIIGCIMTFAMYLAEIWPFIVLIWRLSIIWEVSKLTKSGLVVVKFKCELDRTMEYPGLASGTLWDKTDIWTGSLSRAGCPPYCGQPSPNQANPEQNKHVGPLAVRGAPPAGCLLAGTEVFPACG